MKLSKRLVFRVTMLVLMFLIIGSSFVAATSADSLQQRRARILTMGGIVTAISSDVVHVYGRPVQITSGTNIVNGPPSVGQFVIIRAQQGADGTLIALGIYCRIYSPIPTPTSFATATPTPFATATPTPFATATPTPMP